MSFHDCLVIERADGWMIVVGSQTEQLPLDAPPHEMVTSVELMIKLAGLKSVNCVLAPASTSCFFQRLHAGEAIDVRDRAALTYELEDHLPIDAESMVADFVVLPTWPGEQSEHDKMVSAVAIEFDRWHVIAEAFESAGIPVRSVVPAAILAARSICRDLNLTDFVEVVLIELGHAELIKVQSDSVLDWKHCKLDRDTLRRHRQLDDVVPDRVVVVGADEAIRPMLEEIYGEIEFTEDGVEPLVVRGAKLLLANASHRWFDLRRDQLSPSDPLRPIRSELRLVAAAVTICLLALVVGPWWRTQRIETEMASVRSQQQALFKKAFPDVRVPAALLRRVRSEHTRVMGSRGTSTDIELPQSAPEVLRGLLSALGADIRFRVTSIDIRNGQIDLDLQVRSPVDAGAIASSLADAGFEVKPPVITQQDAKTFDALLKAEWRGHPLEAISASTGLAITTGASG